MLQSALPSISIVSRSASRGFRSSAAALGGARPGGSPTFNWKQRKQLGLDVKSDGDGIILESFGNFEDLLKDEKYRGGTFEEIVSDGKRTYSAPKIKENVSQRKKVNMSMLFGPGKPAGPPCLVKVKQRFSHRRVFGHKGEASQSANQKA